MPNKQDTNTTGLAIAEEVSLKTLPSTPVWYGQEPNSYSDFGGDINSVARAPISPSRQRLRGTITEVDASGGFSLDMTKTNTNRLMQGFFFANMREKFSTAPYNGTAIPITSVSATQYLAASGLAGFNAKALIFASGFANAANNGLKVVSAVAAGAVTVAGNVVEASPPAAAKLETCGIQFTAADVALTLAGNTLVMTSATVNMTTLGLNVGEWVFIGGDNAANQFTTGTNKPGYARISAINATQLIFDKTTWTPSADTGIGKTVQVFFGYVIRNEDVVANIIRRSYQLERQLGNDGVGIQSEYVVGAVANEMKLNIPVADKATLDLSFVGLDVEQRTGAVGVKSGTRVGILGEDAINTTSDVYRVRMQVVDPVTLNPTPLFGYVTEANISINNGASPNKAVGVLGGFDVSVGDFEVGGSVTAYFSDVGAITAIRQNKDVTFDVIFAKKNIAIAYDIPLMGLGGGRVALEKDKPITIPIDMMAAKGANNYTLLACFMPYVPTIANAS